MIGTESQGADATLDELAPFLDGIYEMVEGAVQEGVAYFDTGDEIARLDPVLFPSLVRYHVKVALELRGMAAVDDEDEAGFDHEILANNGLLLTVGSRRIRIRKADHGHLPIPTSETLRTFYEQDALFKQEVEVQNLLLLWDLVEGKLELQLVCPRQPGVAPHWAVPLTHPAEHQIGAEPTEETFEFDVPITLPEASSDDD